MGRCDFVLNDFTAFEFYELSAFYIYSYCILPLERARGFT